MSVFRPALIVVDVQEDFCPPNGPLAVEGGRDIAPIINDLLMLPGFISKIATSDYHPEDHISFASNHKDAEPFETYIDIKNHLGGKPEETMKQRLWPVHCLIGHRGSQIIKEIGLKKLDLLISKGMDARVEMYSAFADSFGNKVSRRGVSHDLEKLLTDKEITHVYVVGLAGDYCVKWTAIDAAKAGFQTYVIDEAQRCVDPNQGWSEARNEMDKSGVRIISIDSEEVARVREL